MVVKVFRRTTGGTYTFLVWAKWTRSGCTTAWKSVPGLNSTDDDNTFNRPYRYRIKCP